MKNFVLLIYLSFLALTLYAQPTKVTGFIKGYSAPKIYMSILNGPKLIRDSAVVNNGYFEFIVDVKEPLAARLITRDPNKRIVDKTSNYTSFAPAIQIFIEPQIPVSISGDYTDWPISTIKGGANNQLQTDYYLKHKLSILQEEKTLKESIALKNQGNAAKAKLTDSIRFQYTTSNTDAYAKLANRNGKTLFNAFYIYELLSFINNEKQLEKIVTAFEAPIKNGVYGLAIQERYKELSQAALGTLVKDFKVNGKDSTININAFRGKYVLLDFWGSWCVPCREGNPKLKKLYANYKEKGFEIIAIALERGKTPRQDWLKAIKDDDLPWINILNNEAIEKNGQDLIRLFAIKSYPTKILINPAGKIVLRTQGDNEEIEALLKKAYP